MRKSTIPVAVVLAASAVPVQAQDAVELSYTQQELLQKCDNAIQTVSTYANEVKGSEDNELSYLAQLAILYKQIEGLSSDASQETLNEYNGNIDTILAAAEAKEKEYAKDYYDLLTVIETEGTKKTDAQTTIDRLSPLVQSEYQTQFDGITPSSYTEAELETFHNDPAKAQEALDKVKANIEAYQKIIYEAPMADQDAKDAQDTLKAELLKSIGVAKTAAETDLEIVKGYINYVDGDENAGKISAAISEYDQIKADVETAAANNTLTDKTAYETRITAQKNNVSDATTAAETAAKAAAKEYSDNAVSGLTKYTLSSEGDDENTIAKKQAANAAIDAAIDKAAKGHDIISKGSDRTTFESELATVIANANNAISAVTLAENNYKAYEAAKTYIEGLQEAYNEVAIKLSSMKVDGTINTDIYNDANNKLNEVAATIAKMQEDNKTNYDGEMYKKPVDGDDVDEVYAELVGRLNTGTINDILDNATAANGNYNELTTALATAKISAEEVNNDTMQTELEAEYNNAWDAIDAYAKDATDENKTAADEALDAYNTAIATATADLQAYNDALKMIEDWQKDLDSVVLPNLGEDSNYPDKQEIINLNIANGTLDGQLASSKTTVENSFKANPRTCQGALSDLENGTLGTQVSTWKSDAQTALEKYNEWTGTQADETLYNEATRLVANLQAELDAAKTTAPDAKGYDVNQTAIDALTADIEKHNEEGHTTGCVSNFQGWETKIKEISASIKANKQAYEDDLAAYNTLNGTLSSLKNDDYYKALTDKSEVDEKIAEVQTALDGYKSAQTVVENKTSVENSVTEIKDLIASTYLQQEAGEVENSLATAKATIDGDATLNPDNHYSGILSGYETTLTGLKASYSTAKYSEIGTKKTELDKLKDDIEQVVPDAQENYQKYQAQLANQKKNKADWAKIYSEVGALYSGEQFAGAQALYQGKLNDCLKVINYYDAVIESKYKNGESAKFATEDYDEKIADNKTAMEAISKAARDNRTTYDSQTERVETLNTTYTDAVDAIQAQIDDVTAKIAAAEEGTDTSDLTDKKTSLETQMTELTGVKTRIDALDTAVGEKVNKGESVEYDDTFTPEYSDILQAISDILASAGDTYDKAISAHNKIVIDNFRTEYAKAKTLYNDVVYAISKYASYEHALDAKGNSAYAAAIQTANEGLFPIIEELKAINKNAEDSCVTANKKGNYFDLSQSYKNGVEDKEATINGILAAFLNETQTIANNNGYAADITALSTKYNGIVSAIDGYTYKEAAKTAFEAIEGGKASAVVDAYVAAKAENKGPQVIDDLKLKIVTDNADTNLDKAYNEAAKAEADGHITAAKAEIAANPKSAYPLSATWETTIANANAKVNAAQAALDASYAAGTVPADLTTILGNLDGIDTMFEDVKATAEAEQKAAKAEQAITDQYDVYEGQIAKIADGDEEEDIKGINDYKAPYEYADKLTDLLADGDAAVAAAREANELAMTFGYKDDAQIEIGTVKVNKWRSIVSGKVYTQEEYNKLESYEKYFCQPISVDEPVYYAGTAKQYVEEKIAAAQSVLDQIEDKVAELEANDLRLIVNNLKEEVETLIPLYNRAVANGGDEDALAGIYTDIENLRTSVTITATIPEEDIEQMASEDNQKYVREQIKTLKQRIEAQDAEYQTYASLMEALDGVKTQLAEAQAKIDAAGDFTADLETAFATDKANIQNAIAKAEKDLNADHANNLCGKEGAKVTEATVSNIAADITTLSENIDTKRAELQTAAQDAATREANNEAFNTANTALNNLYQTLQDAVDEIETLAVQTSYIERENALKGEIDAAISSLKTACDEANAGEHPTALDTSAAQQAAETINGKISTLLSDAQQAQDEYENSLSALQERISALETTISGIEISEIAAANEEVIQAQQELDAVKQQIDDKMAAVNPYVIEDINILVDEAEQLASALVSLIEEKTYVPGDISGDGTVNVLDLSLIRDLVSGKKDAEELEENQAKAADMDKDGEYTVADLVQINNIYVFGNKYGQNVAAAKAAMKADVEPGSMSMQMDTDNMDVMLNSSTGYAALQMDVVLPAGVNIREVGFAGESKNVMVTANVLENGSYRIVLYTVDGSNMLNGENRLLNLKLAGEGTGVVSIDNIIASTGAGMRHNLDAVSGAYTIVTGIEAVETTEGNSSVFGTDGVVRRTLQKGINIVKDAAGKVKKVLVK